MTSIVVAKRDGIATAPDGTKYRTARGKTLADARHPLVEAYPGDWTPMRVDLPVDEPEGIEHPPCAAQDEVDELRNDLAEAEELAEHRGAELLRLAEGLAGFGYTLPDEADRGPGWLVDLVLDALPVLAPAPAELPVDAPAPHSATAAVAAANPPLSAALEKALAPPSDDVLARIAGVGAPAVAPPRAPRKPRRPL